MMIKNFTGRFRIIFAILLVSTPFVKAEDLQPSNHPLPHAQLSTEDHRAQLQAATLEDHLEPLRKKLNEYKELIEQVNQEGGKLSELKKIMIRQLITSIPEITFATLSTEDIASVMEGSTLIFYQPAKRIAAEIEQNRLTLDTAVSTEESDTPQTIRKDMSSTTFFDEILDASDFKTILGMIARNEVFDKVYVDSLQLAKDTLIEYRNHITATHIEAQRIFNKYYLFDDHLQTHGKLDPNKQSSYIPHFALQIARQRQQYFLQILRDLISPNELTESELEKPENLSNLEQYLADKKKEAYNQVSMMGSIEEKILAGTLLVNEIDKILNELSE